MVHISRDNIIYGVGAAREKALSLGQSVRSFASFMRYPHEVRPKFLTCQKFIHRPIACRERLIASRFPLYTARTLHDKRRTTKLKFGPTQKRLAGVRIRLKIG